MIKIDDYVQYKPNIIAIAIKFQVTELKKKSKGVEMACGENGCFPVKSLKKITKKQFEDCYPVH